MKLILVVVLIVLGGCACRHDNSLAYPFVPPLVQGDHDVIPADLVDKECPKGSHWHGANIVYTSYPPIYGDCQCHDNTTEKIVP